MKAMALNARIVFQLGIVATHGLLISSFEPMKYHVRKQGDISF